MDLRKLDSTVLALSLVGLAAPGCGHPPASEGSASNGETGSEGGCELHSPCSECSYPAFADHRIDVLLVVDGTAGSQGAQARLGAALDGLVTALEASEIQDYRIGVTTTDMGAPPCDPLETTPEIGALLGSSCRERLGEFVDEQGMDHSALCTDACGLDTLALLPSPVLTQDGELVEAVRPWIEHDGQQTNLPEGVELAEALRCMAMVGVRSCPYEAPMAAILQAYTNSLDPEHPSFGFFRPQTRAAILLLTDAVDCSWTDVGEAIFDPDGLRAFWSDPNAEAPTPALCFAAGTDCPTFDGIPECSVGYYGVDGGGVGLGDPVLGRVSNYADAIRFLSGWTADVLFLMGVPVDGELSYSYDADPAFLLEHGIAPSCEGPDGTVALPPVRLLDLAHKVTQFNDPYTQIHSVCEPDFGAQIDEWAARLRDSVSGLTCYSSAVCDRDPDTPVLELDCEIRVALPGAEPFYVPECARDGDGYVVDPDSGRAAMPDAETELCFVAHSDLDGLSSSPLDDAWPACTELSSSIGIELVSADGREPDLEWSTIACVEQ